MSNQIRLDKALANMGLATRKEVKLAVKKGQILLNDCPVKQSDIKITSADRIAFYGNTVQYQEFEYYMLNKPAGYVSATTDNRDQTVMELLSERSLNRKDLFPVGRLDKDTVGLLLITNNGALAHRLLSPANHVDKTYYVKVKGMISEDAIVSFGEGISIGDEKCLPAKLEILEQGEISCAKLTIREGKFHQVKRMFHSIGNEVIYLKRLSMGPLRLDEALQEGEVRPLTDYEIELLEQAGE